MNRMNAAKYRPYPPVGAFGRTWPDQTITKAPVWCSVDLRDGNQALPVPMNIEEKMQFFSFLVGMGFKEIEVGFPSAAAVEYAFVRKLIEEDRIPDDVTIQVLVQAREHLIRRTFEAIAGAKKAVVHLYNSTSTAQREVVFRKSRAEVLKIAVEGTALVRRLADESGNPGIRFEYSPESFTGTEPEYALEVCAAVADAWGPTRESRMIVNLPSTVEMSTPNVFADRVEWFLRAFPGRERIVLSVHPHNDRGTAVAAGELAVLAGAERVEGALFGNGERCGNLDIVTMALNLFSRGVDPGLDFSQIDRVVDIYRRCTRMEVPPRHPYAGELVYTAFSGSHQDAISKGMKAYAAAGGVWEVPYLPVDPKDLGRTYEAIVRINSQSGKGGAAYVLERERGIQLPKWMQADFGRAVQAVTDATGTELSPAQLVECFEKEYITPGRDCRLVRCHVDSDEVSPGGKTRAVVRAVVEAEGREIGFEAAGTGPVDAFARGLAAAREIRFTVEQYAEHALGHGSDARAAAFIGIRDNDGREACGAGIDADISMASVRAVVSAVNRLAADGKK